MGELVVPAGRRRGGSPLAGVPLGVGRRDQPQLGVEDADQVVEVAGRLGVARGLAELGLRPHLALDVGAGLGQQGLQDGLRRLLVQAVLGRRRRGAEGLFEERHADALRCRRPPAASPGSTASP